MRLLLAAIIVLSALHSRFTIAEVAISLECESLQQLCPGDNKERTCTCTSTASSLKWTTNPPLFFNGTGIAFDSSHTVNTTASQNGFTARLTDNTAGQLTSVMTFTTSAVSNMGTVFVICEVSGTPGTEVMRNVSLTYADRPSFSHTSSYVSCDSSGSGIFQQTIQLHIADTGGAPILRYTGVYTNNLLGVSTPINTTNSSYTITGLNCSRDYTVTFNAVNCAGSTATAPTTYKGVTNTNNIKGPTVTRACLNGSSVNVEWMAQFLSPVFCFSVLSYTVMVTSGTGGGNIVTVNVDSMATRATVDISSSSSTFIITITSNTECGAITSDALEVLSSDICVMPMPPIPTSSITITTLPSSTTPLTTCTTFSSLPELSATCLVALGVGIPVTFLLTAIIFSLLGSLITYLCLNKRGSLKLSTASRAQEPVYADVRDTGTSGGIEMKHNASYGQVTTKANTSDVRDTGTSGGIEMKHNASYGQVTTKANTSDEYNIN